MPGVPSDTRSTLQNPTIVRLEPCFSPTPPWFASAPAGEIEGVLGAAEPCPGGDGNDPVILGNPHWALAVDTPTTPYRTTARPTPTLHADFMFSSSWG
jgi:hypothetical protein